MNEGAMNNTFLCLIFLFLPVLCRADIFVPGRSEDRRLRETLVSDRAGRYYHALGIDWSSHETKVSDKDSDSASGLNRFTGLDDVDASFQKAFDDAFFNEKSFDRYRSAGNKLVLLSYASPALADAVKHYRSIAMQRLILEYARLGKMEALAAGPEDRLFTQREMVSRASALIDGADWVVGTGRSLMEAASRGKPLLVPLADAPQPALLGPNNFDRLFGSNFSARSRVPGFRLDENLNSILEAMDSKERLDEIGRFSRRMFEEHFSIATVVPRYLALYDAVGSQARQRLFDTALETGRILRRR